MCSVPGPSKSRLPSAYIPHGGGPLPVLGDAFHRSLVDWLGNFVSKYLSPQKPTSILVISAHWEAPVATVQSGDVSSLYFDYYGFPREAYTLEYPVPAARSLATRVVELLTKANIPNAVDTQRGFDLGVVIPLKIMCPAAGIPTLQLSLVKNLDPEMHLRIREALAPLMENGVFILGSGMSYERIRKSKSNEDSEPFHAYLRNALGDERKQYQEKLRN